MIAGLLERQPGGQRAVGVPDCGQIGRPALVSGLYSVVKAGQVVGACAGDVVVADSPPAGQRCARLVESGHLRGVIPDPRDGGHAVVLVAGGEAELPQGLCPGVGGFRGHAFDGAVDGGVEARHAHRYMRGLVGITDGDGGAGLLAGLGVEQHEPANQGWLGRPY